MVGKDLAAEVRDMTLELYHGRFGVRGEPRDHHRRHQVRVRATTVTSWFSATRC